MKLLFQMVFWSAVCVMFAITVFSATRVSLLHDFVFNIASGWFPKSYLALFVVAPLLNCYIQGCSENVLLKYIGVFYLLSTIGGYLLRFDDFNEGMSVMSLIGLYLIGAYLRKSSLKIFHLKAVYDLLLYLGMGVFMVVISILLICAGISSSPYGYLNPIVILMSVYLFLFFKKFEIKNNRIINFLSASAFSVYLFHYNPLCFGGICKIWTYINLNYGVLSSLGLAILSFVVIYLFCVLVDRIRIFVFNNCIGRFCVK